MKQLFTSLLWQHPDFAPVEQAMARGQYPINLVGVSAVHKANIAAALHGKFDRPVLVVVPDEVSGRRMCEDLCVMLEERASAFYPMREFTFRDVDSVSLEYEQERLGVLGRVVEGDVRVVVASVEGLLERTLPPDEYRSRTITLEAGKDYDLTDLAKKLVRAGYVRRDMVDGVSQFAIRGGILDVFPAQDAQPLRAEFWGDTIDSISTFDLETQRRDALTDIVHITPAREVLFEDEASFAGLLATYPAKYRGKQRDRAAEAVRKDADRLRDGTEIASLDKYLPLLYGDGATLLDYMPDAFVLVSELTAVRESARTFIDQTAEDVSQLMEEGVLARGMERYTLDTGELLSALGRRELFLLDTFARSAPELPPKTLISLDAVQSSPWGGEQKLLFEDVRNALERKFCVVVLAGSDKAARNVATDLSRQGINAVFAEDVRQLTYGRVNVLEGTLSTGFEYPKLRLSLIAHLRSTASRTENRRRSAKKGPPGQQLKSLTDLHRGNYVVHETHGIGVFDGVVPMKIDGVTKDYIKINYAGNDQLFVPVTQLDMVAKYVGPTEDKAVKLNRLNSGEWQKTRTRVKKAVKDMADELIQLYAARMRTPGHAFAPDDDWQRDFEDRFEWQETDDQLRCIEEIKADMERPVPMERLLCGDVGFGKTEVAIRAAFKCVMDSMQCAILVPTTILAWQHYQTLLQRMEGFPVNIELLSRFRTPKQQEAIIRKIRRGEIDIIVGTHRLLSKDVQYHNLGLAIIDEEQRFGVAHKEKFKELFHGVDVLTLSATPIPRTLNMAMSGIRDMSTLDEAPQDRHPIQTYVLEYDERVVGDAIRRELRRGGQVFYLYNQVDTIEKCAARVQAMAPEARVIIGHGQMSEDELSIVWQKLIDRECDILVATTIIESGVDVPNCNTLIIENADRLGLSQLYQLRGRVGRSSRRAYAYFTFQRGKVLNEIATKRLDAIREFTSFGSGFNIAMRDLEIRGAGNILSGQQHGHMEAVGYDMYLSLLGDAIAEGKGEVREEKTECLVDIRIEAHIPEDFIPDNTQRLDIYRKIAGVRTQEDAMDVSDEIIDRFGDLPEAVHGLITVALLRNRAAAAHIKEIAQKDNTLVFYSDSIDPQKALALATSYRDRCSINSGKRPGLAVRLAKGQQPLDLMREVLDQLAPEPAEEKKRVSGGKAKS